MHLQLVQHVKLERDHFEAEPAQMADSHGLRPDQVFPASVVILGQVDQDGHVDVALFGGVERKDAAHSGRVKDYVHEVELVDGEVLEDGELGHVVGASGQFFQLGDDVVDDAFDATVVEDRLGGVISREEGTVIVWTFQGEAGVEHLEQTAYSVEAFRAGSGVQHVEEVRVEDPVDEGQRVAFEANVAEHDVDDVVRVDFGKVEIQIHVQGFEEFVAVQRVKVEIAVRAEECLKVARVQVLVVRDEKLAAAIQDVRIAQAEGLKLKRTN